MKFMCEKALLYEGINLALHAVSAKSTIPALEGILLSVDDGLTLSGYDLEIGIRTFVPAQVESKGACIISARLFANIVRQLDDQQVTVETDENNIAYISCGYSSFDIPTLPASDFPAFPVINGEMNITISQFLLKSMIQQTVFAVASNDSKPIFTGSLFDVSEQTLRVVAVDNFRGLAIREEEITHQNTERCFSFVVPGVTLREIEKILKPTDEPVELSLTQKHIMFKIDDTVLISRLLEGEFIKYEKYIPQQSPIVLSVNTKEFAKRIERVSVINDKLSSPLKCRFENGVIKISTRAFGNSKDECAAEGNGRDTVMGFNYRYLTDALRAIEDETTDIEISTGTSPLILRRRDSSKYIYLVMPMRIKENE